MSIRHGLLALLAERPMYGYQLRVEFEARTGSTWPLNVGQVYTTLQRLARDDLVEPADRADRVRGAEGAEGADGADGADGAEGAGRTDDQAVVYRLTERGRAEAEQWWSTPVTRGAPARDELAIKLALAVTLPGVDVTRIVQRQRAESVRAIQRYTRLARQAAETSDAANDMALLLVLDSLIFAAEAEIRWLDHVESRLQRAARRRSGTTTAPPPSPPPSDPPPSDPPPSDPSGGRAA